MNPLNRTDWLTGLGLGVGAVLVGCGSDAPDRTSQDASISFVDTGTATSSDSLVLTYSPMYSAFIEGGAHEAQVPVMLKDSSLRGVGASFSSSDPSIAAVVNTDVGALIAIKKEGFVIITARVGGTTGAAKLTITKYTEAQWQAGRARFAKSELAIVPGTPGGPITLRESGAGGTLNANGACSTCHTAQAQTLKVEVSPKQIGGYSDDELVLIFTKGMKPEALALRTQIPAFAWGRFHSWTVTEDEKQGLVAFLRTQPPKDNPVTIDYGVNPCADAGSTGNFCHHDGSPTPTSGLPGPAPIDDGGALSNVPDAGA